MTPDRLYPLSTDITFAVVCWQMLVHVRVKKSPFSLEMKTLGDLHLVKASVKRCDMPRKIRTDTL